MVAASKSNGKARTAVREIIGRVSVMADGNFFDRFASVVSIDKTVTNYKFWDNFRRGKEKGYKLAGLFAAPISEIIAGWVMGDGFTATTGDDYTDGLLAQFVKRMKATLLNLVVDQYALGDQYVITNPDGTWSVPSPETVRPDYDPLDYRHILGYTVTTKLDKATITDVYRLEGRYITIETADKDLRAGLIANGWLAVVGESQKAYRVFENLIGRIPVVHFANDRSNNETHGRPIYERGLPLFARYDDALNKMLDGVMLMGNPMPVFEGLEDVDETIRANSTPTGQTYIDVDGNTVERTQVAFDTLGVLFLGKGGLFKFASPGTGFTNDVRNALKVLFLLLLETARIPEVVWGNEQSGQLSTGNEQMRSFYAFIQARRVMLEGEGASDDLGFEAKDGLMALLDIWLRTMALVNPRIKVAPVSIEWPELSGSDMEIILKWAQAMHNAGVITDETFVTLSQLVEDPAAEAEAARKEREERMPDLNDIEAPSINEGDEDAVAADAMEDEAAA